MIQFYSPDIESTLVLPAEESLHCSRVLRKKEGDEIFVTDGKGSRFECVVEKADPKKTTVRILNKISEPKGWRNRITVAVAPTKNIDRMSWLVEKAVEIGVDDIVFVDCRRNERHKLSVDRLRRVAVSAMKQSLKTVLPQMGEMMSLKDLLNQNNGGGKFFGYCDENTERKNFASDYTKGSDVVILIGPEGDFSPEEVELLKESGFIPVTFGESRLRTETAALFGINAVHVLNSL